MKEFLPEGKLFNSSANKYYLQSEAAMQEAFEQGITLEGHAVRCTPEHDLQVELPFGVGIIPRCEGAIGIAEGVTRDIALLSRVNKTVCFKVMEIRRSDSTTVCILSRRQAQTECMDEYISKLSCGDVIPAKVTHLEPFGCFADIGCGIVSLMPIDAISVSRISHPSDRFFNGQDIFAVVKDISGGRITLSHKELLGTWEQNAALFSAGETVGGIVRSVEPYGVFIELAPNLAGLAEPQDNVREGQAA
ncbi:MAG: S1 RNA-binding domain-containing protein, partial [Ruminococcus sp.]|nr:S1 RNA-binding domain-containing protein [Ruminococcus sp.]